jgi:integrase
MSESHPTHATPPSQSARAGPAVVSDNRKPKRKRAGPQSAKPYPDFPLTAHPSGRWCKKVRGRLLYFGPIEDPDGALDKWLRDKDDLLAGRVPRRVAAGGLTVGELCRHFLEFKLSRLESGRLSPVTLGQYMTACRQLCEQFGSGRPVTDLRPEDFAGYLAAIAKGKGEKRTGLVMIKNRVNLARIIFNHAWENRLIEQPVFYGTAFEAPTRADLRKDRARRAPASLTLEQIRCLLNAAGSRMRAMMLLALNGGLGNNDLAQFQRSHVDLQAGWVNYPRPKTGAARRFPLWPETVTAIRAALAERTPATEPADDGCLFLNSTGRRLVRRRFDDATEERPAARVVTVDDVSREFADLRCRLGIEGAGFYELRHCHRTVAGGCRDKEASDFIMGHLRGDMSECYCRGYEDERLLAVCEHVRRWLFAPTGKPGGKGSAQRNLRLVGGSETPAERSA